MTVGKEGKGNNRGGQKKEGDARQRRSDMAMPTTVMSAIVTAVTAATKVAMMSATVLTAVLIGVVTIMTAMMAAMMMTATAMMAAVMMTATAMMAAMMMTCTAMMAAMMMTATAMMAAVMMTPTAMMAAMMTTATAKMAAVMMTCTAMMAAMMMTATAKMAFLPLPSLSVRRLSVAADGEGVLPNAPLPHAALGGLVKDVSTLCRVGGDEWRRWDGWRGRGRRGEGSGATTVEVGAAVWWKGRAGDGGDEGEGVWSRREGRATWGEGEGGGTAVVAFFSEVAMGDGENVFLWQHVVSRKCVEAVGGEAG